MMSDGVPNIQMHCLICEGIFMPGKRPVLSAENVIEADSNDEVMRCRG